MRYSEEFKNHVVSRLLTGEVTIAQAQEQYGVSTFSLREWRKKALSQAGESSTAETHEQENLQMSKLRLPKGVTYLQAYEAVAAKRLLSETDYGAYCRKNGLVNTTVEGWAKWFAAHPDACNSEDLQTERQLRVQAQRDAAAKDKELARKDKALSETATMLVLAKKRRRSGEQRKADQCPRSPEIHRTDRRRHRQGVVSGASL